MIKQILEQLTHEQLSQLMYAFEELTSTTIELPLNHFVGVNVVANESLIIKEQEGVWSYGIKINHN